MKGKLDTVIRDKEHYRLGSQVLRVYSLDKEYDESKSTVVWAETKYWQDKKGKIHKKW